ncbi:MAG: antitoxin [bacterium]|nr:antitoxin [bacterium]
MPRTTLNIDYLILQELKMLRQNEQKPLGQLVSELVCEALTHRRKAKPAAVELPWISKPMRARIDISDKEALYAVLDRKVGVDEPRR